MMEEVEEKGVEEEVMKSGFEYCYTDLFSSAGHLRFFIFKVFLFKVRILYKNKTQGPMQLCSLAVEWIGF